MGAARRSAFGEAATSSAATTSSTSSRWTRCTGTAPATRSCTTVTSATSAEPGGRRRASSPLVGSSSWEGWDACPGRSVESDLAVDLRVLVSLYSSCLELAWWTLGICAAKRAWQGRGRNGMRLGPGEEGSLLTFALAFSCTLSCHGGWYERWAALPVQHMRAGFSFFAEVAAVRTSQD